MKKIQLGKGEFTLVDDEDFCKLSLIKWRILKARGYTKDYVYGYISSKKRHIFLHRFLMNPQIGMVVDHINGDGLDNRKKNLRICTTQENSRSRRFLQKNNTTGYQGVKKNKNGWESQIKVNGKMKYLGYSKDKTKAAKIYDEAAKKYHGEFATLNFPKREIIK